VGPGVTTDNHAVDSIYLRLLAPNPAVRGHNTDVAVAGTGVDDLAGQAAQVAARLPGPRAANSGTGPCDLFDPAGKPVPAIGAP
jgi:hypothetical protein